MKKAVFLVIAAVLSTGVFAARANNVTFSGNSVTSDARLELVTMAETGAQTASVERVRALVESYRIDREKGFLPLGLAPYPRFLLNAQLGEIYSALYDSELESFLNHIPLELLFDGLLEMVAQGTATGELKKQTKQLSKKMARRALKGKSDPKCVLDPSDKIEKVSLVKKIGMKADIFNFLSPCAYRKRIYNLAKPALIEARSKPETKATVREAALKYDPKLGEGKFENEFRKGFLAKINETVGGFPALVQKKFGAGNATHPIWSESGSVLEGDALFRMKDGRRVVRMKSFAQGLLADLFAANVLIKSADPKDKSLAAGLFYAVVNRWLFLTGGIQADWDSARKGMPVAVMGKGRTPPKYREVRFGGWGAETEGFGVSMSAWDWAGYKPSDEKAPTALRIFPTRFVVDANGVGQIPNPAQAYQTNDDLAYLLLAVSEFLKVTQPGTPLAQFFGGKDKIGDLLDPTKPLLFPEEGRVIAVGVLAAVAQNLLHPIIGHIGSKREGIPIFFRDRGRFGALQERDIDTRGVCSVLVAASKLTKTLRADPIMTTEPSLAEILPQISQLVQISALVVGREQGFDGAVSAKMNSADKSTNLGAQIAAVRVFLAALNDSEAPEHASFVKARLDPALRYLFSTQLKTAKIDLEAKLNLLAVWNQSQAAFRTVRPDLPWAEWEGEIRKLSAR